MLVKDNQPVSGVRATYGGVFADRVAAESHAVVEAIEAAGGVVIGLTNMPEHAAGAHTFNEVHGTTCNPWDLGRTVGGSSGGACAALAAGEAWLAAGTDLGGSLRNPAAYCGVVGLRPSPGRTPSSAVPARAWRGRWGPGLHSVHGPHGRTVADAALLLDALVGSAKPGETAAGWAGGEDSLPNLPPPPTGGYLRHVQRAAEHAPASVAYSADLGGLLRGVDPEVGAAVERAARRLGEAAHGADVSHASPIFPVDTHEVFLTPNSSLPTPNFLTS